jgi:hypothetical protein
MRFAGETKAPLHVVHINSAGTTATAEMLTRIANARAQGLDVTTEAYPYAAGMTEIQSANLDEYQDAPAEKVALLEWPKTGERLNRETFQKYRKMGGPFSTRTRKMVNIAVTSPLTMIASDSYWENGTGHHGVRRGADYRSIDISRARSRARRDSARHRQWRARCRDGTSCRRSCSGPGGSGKVGAL